MLIIFPIISNPPFQSSDKSQLNISLNPDNGKNRKYNFGGILKIQTQDSNFVNQSIYFSPQSTTPVCQVQHIVPQYQMTQFPNIEIIEQSFHLKIQDLQIWFNPTIYQSISALIRIQSTQYPLIVKETSQTKLKLKNKSISHVKCLYDVKKHKYLPLKIEVDINLEYKGGKTHGKRFLINLNQFKTIGNKGERIKTLKSLERMFSLQIIFKLQNVQRSHYDDNSQGLLTLKNDFSSSKLLQSYYSNEKIDTKNFRIPKNEVKFQRYFYQIQQVKSLNAKTTTVRSPTKMSDFITSIQKKPQKQFISNEKTSFEKNIEQNVISPPKKEKYNNYVKHLQNNVIDSQTNIVKNSYVSYVKGDPYVKKTHRVYTTMKQTSQEGYLTDKQGESLQESDAINNNEKNNDNNLYNSNNRRNNRKSKQQQKDINNVLVEKIKELRKKLSQLSSQKNNLYIEKQNHLLEFEARDKQQKIRHKKQLAQQKEYFEKLVEKLEDQLEETKNNQKQVDEIREINKKYESSCQLIKKLNGQLDEKKVIIDELLKYKELALEQSQQLSKLNQLISELNVLNLVGEKINQYIQKERINNHLNHNNPIILNSEPVLVPNSIKFQIQQLQHIYIQLSSQLQLLQQQLYILQSTNITLNHQYNSKLIQLAQNQQELTKKEEKIQEIQRKLTEKNQFIQQKEQTLGQNQKLNCQFSNLNPQNSAQSPKTIEPIHHHTPNKIYSRQLTQKHPKASSLSSRTYRSTKNQQKSTKMTDQKSKYGCR